MIFQVVSGQDAKSYFRGNRRPERRYVGSGAYVVHRSYADNRVGYSIQVKNRAHDVRVGMKLLLPEIAAQQDDWRRVRLIVLRQEEATAERCGSKHRKVITGNK